jgi:hypothetical protein
MTSSARLALAAALLAATAVAADPYDLRVYKLCSKDPAGRCSTNPADPHAQARFERFVREFGAALTSVSLTPPETLGHSAFAVSAELSVVQFQQEDQYFPTQRLVLDGESSTRPGIDGALLLPSVHVRKGLPWSFEIGTRVAWIEKSRMAAATGELKWALNEGFLLLPDIGVRASVTKLLGTADFDLTAVGADLSVGKQLAVGGMVTFTPYVGWNLVWVGASSNTIDFNPDRPYDESVCGPNPAACDPAAQITQGGAGVFGEVTLGGHSHNRFYGGMRFIAGALQLGAEYSVAALPPIRVSKTETLPAPAVGAFNFTVGLDF